ncbi:cisplatin damage response ATP-dependent DNA ligase [Novosphingobium resinovorum]|uniref:cisplatin damage response ATP-dependent DNA ligase n=1 Tax=Novosphingobium TaxID=165696 RepID=UPI001B3C6B6B|nr:MULTISPECIES: cisplatin damage response ATP-dependent DNA ligase [Novosphingobium]MBF7013163.1 cisplatin damage response ATP-dependent DNA ligase [Novosphingobium sp. HR1a]WJM27889.1 cisplatin damage response ATP-dependent DNA ligase [Novosphingobium resinovorum]
MEAFAALLDALVYTRSRNAKLKLLADYLRDTPDPDRGWALAALTDGLDFPAVKSSTIRNLLTERIDPVLWTLSREYVGDSAETASLLWPEPAEAPSPPTVSEAVDALSRMTRANVMAELPKLLDWLDANGRYALLKLATGAMRIGISARLAKTAFAQAFDVAVEDVEEHWHGQTPPYAPLFDWAAHGAEPPNSDDLPLFRPFMLAHGLEDIEIDLADYAAEWKWDGIRVQVVRAGGETRVYSRSGDDISATFPEVAEALHIDGVLDGELLVRGAHQGGEEGGAASFNALQQRLGRKTVSKKMREEYPAFVRLYDVLILEGQDLRPLPWSQRRAALEALLPRLPADRFDISTVIPAADFADLSAIRERARDDAIEGVMLKRRDSPYVAGRKTGLWYKWKRDPLLIDCVLMYAQRGSGKRSSFYSDYTFGCWDGDPDSGAELLPVGKAYFGFTDEELKWLDRHVRNHTVNRFGPVRETDKSLVFEVAFDSVHASKRHKSGVAMRFPRISRIRADKPAHEADRIETLRALIRD